MRITTLILQSIAPCARFAICNSGIFLLHRVSMNVAKREVFVSYLICCSTLGVVHCFPNDKADIRISSKTVNFPSNPGTNAEVKIEGSEYLTTSKQEIHDSGEIVKQSVELLNSDSRQSKILFSWWVPTITPGASETASILTQNISSSNSGLSEADVKYEVGRTEKETSTTHTPPATHGEHHVLQLKEKPILYSWWTRMPNMTRTTVDPEPQEIFTIADSQDAEGTDYTRESPDGQTSTSKPLQTKRPSRTRRPNIRDRTTQQSDSPHMTPRTVSPTLINTDSTLNDHNYYIDPFGIKRKWVSAAKAAGKVALNAVADQAGSLAISAAGQVAPLARGVARQTGLLVLGAAGNVGTLAKTVAEQAYDNLAKKLNVTEGGYANITKPQDGKSTSSNSVDTTSTINNPSKELTGDRNKHYLDDEPCLAILHQSHVLLIVFGALAPAVWKQVINLTHGW